MLTGVWIEEGGRRGVLASRSGGGIRAAQGRSLRSGRWRAPPASGSPLAASWGSCERVQGVMKARRWLAVSNRGEQKPGRNSHACVAEVENGCLGVDPGSKAELARGFAGARALRGGGFTVAQCTGHGGAEQGSSAVVLGGGRGGVVRTGGSRRGD